MAASKFREYQCVPAIVDNPPLAKVEVTYERGVAVDMGNILTPTTVQNPPKVTWTTEEEAFYTLLLTDPDAPSRSNPEWGEWRHWLIVNIPSSCDLSQGHVISEYIGAGPPEDTGLHRYIFLVFKQPSGVMTCSEEYQPLIAKGRNNTSTRDLVTKYGLGDPIAGNLFQAQWDDYVPQLYAKLAANGQ